MTDTLHGPLLPTRFREAERRGRRLGLPLKVMGRVGEVDEDLMARIGRAFTERDEVGAALADAMRMRAGDPGRVSIQQLHSALQQGVGAVPDVPPALREFLAEVSAVPEWVDFDEIERGAGVYRRLGQNAADVLLQLSLLGGYRFGGPPDLLVATGGLAGDAVATRRRLAETQKWGAVLPDPGSLEPGGEAWRLTVHVRAMHALVNASFEPRWDVARWGLPINQADQAATLGLFDGVLILGSRSLGVRITGRESRALMHLWKWVGHLMGVHPDFLVDDEWERHRLNYHLLLAQADISEAGPRLARPILEAQAVRFYRGWPGPLRRMRARWEQERLLSMLTAFLGARSMRELGLPLRPPWAFGYLLPLNVARYHLLGRTSWGRRALEAWGSRARARILDSYFGDEPEDVGGLTVSGDG